METKSQNPMANSNANKNPPDPVGHMESQVHNQQLSASVVNTPSQARQQLLAQNMSNTITSGGGQNSTGLTSTLPPVGNLTQTSMLNVVGHNNLENMLNISTVARNPVGNSMGQKRPANVFANSPRQMLGRQQVVPQQQQQQSTSSQLLYQPQYKKQKMQHGSIQQSLMQSHIQQQQQQQQNLLQPAQIQPSQQAVMQPSVMQSTSLSNLQQNQQSSVQQGSQPVVQQHSQSVIRQQQQQPQPQPQQSPILHQQQTSMSQQQMLPAAQQQQQLIGQQPDATNIPQNQLIGQPNSIPDLQQQQQRLMSQQNNISNLQQQQLMGQQNNLSNIHQSQLGPQSSVSGLQQSQMLATQSGNSGIPANQHSVHMIQQKVPVQQQMQHADWVPNQAQQSQTELSQQQMMSQIQSQNGQLQHLQQQSNPMQRDIQQRLQNSGALLQHQNVVEQQKQLFQSQSAIPEASSAQTGNPSGADWQEEVYQKIKAMKEMHFTELNEVYSKIAAKLQQHESVSQQTKNEQLEKLKLFKHTLERLVQFLRLKKNDVQIGHKEKLGSVEKQIVSILNSHRPCKPVSLQQGQHPQSHMQPPQAQSQISQMQSLENQMNPQMQSMNVPSSVATMQQNNFSGLQHNSLSSVPAISNSQKSMINATQPALNPDRGQSSTLNSMQQVAMSSLQQNPFIGPQSVDICSLTSQNTLQSNLNNLQPNSAMLQNQHLKQQEQQMLQSQQLKQMQQQLLHRQQQLLHRQQLMQQQQQPAQLSGHHMSPLHQMTDSSDMKMRQQMGVKPGVFQHSSAQRASYHYQQLKPGAPYSMTSPQVLQGASAEVPQHCSPQNDPQNLLSSIAKTGTPLQSALSPFIPSPSTPLAPSPMPGESEKVNCGLSSLSNAGNIAQPQTTAVSGPAQSLAIGTPGISASPLFTEITSPDAAHGNASSVMPSPLTPLAPSPMPGQSEKVNCGISSQSNAGNIAQPQTTAVSGPAQSPAIGTPGISAAPLLTEITSPDAAHGNPSSVMPSPSTPLAPSPMPGESEKVNCGISSQSNAGNVAQPQTTAVSGPAQSLAIGTPGISASPLLAETTSPDAAHGNASSVISIKLNASSVMPSPSTPLAPSAMPGESEKVNCGISSQSNAGNVAQPQTTAVAGPAQSLAIGTPGISASPLLAETTSPDAAHGNPSSVISSKLNAVEQPFERLIKVVKSVSCEALAAAVSDMRSVINMVHRFAGTAPGSDSRGEDLVATTKRRLQAGNFFTPDGTSGAKRMRCSTSAMPSDVVPSGGSINESGKVLSLQRHHALKGPRRSQLCPRAKKSRFAIEEKEPGLRSSPSSSHARKEES